MTIKYGLHFFFELTDNDGQNFLAGIVHTRMHTYIFVFIQDFFNFNPVTNNFRTFYWFLLKFINNKTSNLLFLPWTILTK
jgi:hypothetical protein